MNTDYTFQLVDICSKLGLDVQQSINNFRLKEEKNEQ